MTPEEMIISQKELSNKLKENQELKNKLDTIRESSKETISLIEILQNKLKKEKDDYAIEFKNWCDKIIIEEWIDKTTEQLLEIFKKEKGYEN